MPTRQTRALLGRVLGRGAGGVVDVAAVVPGQDRTRCRIAGQHLDVRLPHRHHRRRPAEHELGSALDGGPGVVRTVIGDQDHGGTHSSLARGRIGLKDVSRRQHSDGLPAGLVDHDEVRGAVLDHQVGRHAEGLGTGDRYRPGAHQVLGCDLIRHCSDPGDQVEVRDERGRLPRRAADRHPVDSQRCHHRGQLARGRVGIAGEDPGAHAVTGTRAVKDVRPGAHHRHHRRWAPSPQTRRGH